MKCTHCGGTLIRGVQIAFFIDETSDDVYLGDYCSVDHAFIALDQVAKDSSVPDTLYLGVRVERDDHDQAALAHVMADLAHRAVLAAMSQETQINPKDLS